MKVGCHILVGKPLLLGTRIFRNISSHGNKIVVNLQNPSTLSVSESGKPLLSQPEFFLPIFADSLEKDFVFFSLDTNWRFTYLSRSAAKVMGLPPAEWIGRTLFEALSEDPCNTSARQMGSQLSPLIPLVKGKCEVMAFDKTLRTLDYWMARILVNQSLVGYSGVFSPAGYAVTEDDLEEVSSLVGKLTKVERQVIELVFQGYHNKSIACELKVAVRTVESRRSRAMVKLQVNSLAQLIQFWTKVQCLRVL